MCSALIEFGGERIVFCLSVETPLSIAELPAPEPTLPTAVSTATGKKLVHLLLSSSGTSEVGQKLPTKDQLSSLLTVPM